MSNTGALEYYILDKDHKLIKCDRQKWGEWISDFKNRRVAQTTLAGYHISTVFLGMPLPHTVGPALFETMVFKENEPPREVWMERCTTWEEAEHMHRRGVAWVGCCAPFVVSEAEEE